MKKEDRTLKKPEYARLLIRDDICLRVEKIYFDTHQVTLRESEKVYNTVSAKNVEFEFSDFTAREKEEFYRNFV